MKPPWALLGTLTVSTAVVVSGVTADASVIPVGESGERAAALVDIPRTLLPTASANGFYWQLTTPQQVEPGTVLLTRRSAHRATEGTRSDDQFFQISRTGSNDVPEAALRAYHRAESVMARTTPGCEISWTLLAAIGRVESNHGRFGGSQLGADGVSRPAIRGPRLDGAGPFAAIRDSDDGRLDHDKVWDRAVGQMQFLPETWRSVARDGDGDGRMDPFDIDDSALGSAVYLCGAGGSLADAEGMARAAFRYNHSDYYVRLVLAFQAGYQTGVFAIPSPPPPPETTRDRPRKKVRDPKVSRPRTTTTRPGTAKPRGTKPTGPAAPPRPTPSPQTPKPTPTPTPKPKPTPKPSVKPSPTPAPPVLTAQVGTWNACGATYCLGSTTLDLGPLSLRDARADSDLDGDGAVETNSQEFDGLSGRQVTLQVVRNAAGLVVYVIDGHGFRNADGTFTRSVVSATP